MHQVDGRGRERLNRRPSAWVEELGMVVIDGGCPLMFGPTADGGHKVMCALLKTDRQGAQARLSASPGAGPVEYMRVPVATATGAP